MYSNTQLDFHEFLWRSGIMHDHSSCFVNLDSLIGMPSLCARSSPDSSVVLSPPLRPISWYPSVPSCSLRVCPPRLRPASIHAAGVKSIYRVINDEPTENEEREIDRLIINLTFSEAFLSFQALSAGTAWDHRLPPSRPLVQLSPFLF